MQQTNGFFLSDEQFFAALGKGLGRAYWHISPQNHEQYRERLLYTCTHNVTYDPQQEEDRAPWLYRLLEKTGAPESYQDDIIKAFHRAEKYHDWLQLLRLVAEFAHHYDDAFHLFCNTIARLARLNANENLTALLLKLAQYNELDLVVDTIADYLTEKSDDDPNDEFWRTIKNHVDTEDLILPMLEWVASSPSLWEGESYHEESIDASIFSMAIDAEDIDADKECATVNDLFAIAEDKLFGNDPDVYHIWAAEMASEQDLNDVFARLLQEERPELQLRYLSVFKEKSLPELHYKILYLAIAGSLEVQAAAIEALSNMQDENLRDFAFTLLQRSPDSLHNGALRLFFKNYESEDAACIEHVISVPSDVARCQALCLNIFELAGKFRDDVELTYLLMWAYENTPSSATRLDIVQLLIDLDAASQMLLEEACQDCDSMTSMFASGELDQRVAF